MKRRLLALLTAVLLMMTAATPAFADVIWEPDNNFYERHRDECVYHDRAYLVNGEKGYAAMRNAPDSLVEIMNVANGTRFYMNFIWTDEDGVQWGIGYPEGDIEGWVALSDMAMIYDYISFKEDHGHEFQEYDGSGDHLTAACVYSYPGGVCGSRMEQGGGDYSFAEGFRNLYTDENGLRWTFIGYYMGHRDGWVCIDDPLNENLGVESPLTVAQVRSGAALNPPVENTDAPGTQSPEPEQNTEVIYPPAEEIPPAMTFPLWLIPVVLILAVIVVTAVIARKRRLK